MIGSTREVVAIVLRDHPKDCIFKSRAVDRICEFVTAPVGSELWFEQVLQGLEDTELYCPHEGINRMPKVEHE